MGLFSGLLLATLWSLAGLTLASVWPQEGLYVATMGPVRDGVMRADPRGITLIPGDDPAVANPRETPR